MRYLRNLVYLAAILATSPWLLWSALRQGKYRDGWAEKLLGRVPTRTGNGRCIWFHAVSVGEVNLLKPILDQISRQAPHVELVISTTTKTGLQVAREKYGGLCTFYCPLDFSWAVSAAMRRIRPDMLVLAELELWPNLIEAAKHGNAVVAVVNARLSEKSYRGYQRLRWVLKSTIKQIDFIAAQNQNYQNRFLQIGAEPNHVHVTGSMKFDGACVDRKNLTTLQLAHSAGIDKANAVFLAGSTQDPEESYALAAFAKLRNRYPQLRLILVPRHPERFDRVARLLDQSGLTWIRRTTMAAVERKLNDSAAVLLVDTVGELGAWWGVADVAFVGGSMGNRGGQNMIEPAAYGAAVCFGPHTKNFRDVVGLLLAHDAAKVVRSAEELTQFVQNCMESPASARLMGQRAQDFVSSQLGATARTVQLLFDYGDFDLNRLSDAA